MNSLERIAAAVAFEESDRVPVIAQVFGHAAVMSGVSLKAYLRDGELLAQCQIKALEKYGYDAVFAVMDVNVETEASRVDTPLPKEPICRGRASCLHPGFGLGPVFPARS